MALALRAEAATAGSDSAAKRLWRCAFSGSRPMPIARERLSDAGMACDDGEWDRHRKPAGDQARKA